MKDKKKSVNSAKDALKAIKEYKKLPDELRKELEKDKNKHVSKIIDLERMCIETLEKYEE